MMASPLYPTHPPTHPYLARLDQVRGTEEEDGVEQALQGLPGV